jgi:hypothetical protein
MAFTPVTLRLRPFRFPGVFGVAVSRVPLHRLKSASMTHACHTSDDHDDSEEAENQDVQHASLDHGRFWLLAWTQERNQTSGTRLATGTPKNTMQSLSGGVGGRLWVGRIAGQAP